MWSQARWTNGMEAAHSGVIECGKTIVCGHWHCSFGHANYEGKGSEFDQDADFAPYYADGMMRKTEKQSCLGDFPPVWNCFFFVCLFVQNVFPR